MKHILVATDLGPCSDRAVRRAEKLAGEHRAKLTVAHVIDPKAATDESDAATGEPARHYDAERRLWRHYPGVFGTRGKTIDPVVKIGLPWSAIIETAAERHCDLIVLGVPHIETLKDAFVGSTAECVIRHCPIPVLVVKVELPAKYQRVLVASDFSPPSSHALRTAFSIAGKAEFFLLHAFETPYSAFLHLSEEELAEYRQQRIKEAESQIERDLEPLRRAHLGAVTPKISILAERGEAVGQIIEVTRRIRPDLIAIGTRARSGMLGAMIGSVACAILRAPPCDILIAH
jgi:nucleotide-binding universal stress UspA family protein